MSSLIRFAFIPSESRFPTLYDCFKKHQAMFWTKAVVKPANDLKDWNKMDTNSRHFIMNVLGFFAGSDKIVMDNLKERVIPEIRIYEAELFIAFQMGIEAIHSEVYGDLIDVLITNPVDRDRLSYAIDKIPSVGNKAKWAQKWTKDSGSPLSERLLAYTIVEGVFFSGSFCSIYWLKSQGKMLDGLCKSNDLISKDEKLHVNFNIELYNIVTNPKYINDPEVPYVPRLSYARVIEIINEAVEIESEFIRDSLPWKLPDMNAKSMIQYIQYNADTILQRLGYKEPDGNLYYGVQDPFTFTRMLGMETKGDFFQTENVNYQQTSVLSSESGKKVVFDEPF